MKTAEILAFRIMQLLSFGVITLAILGLGFAIIQIATGNYTETSSREF